MIHIVALVLILPKLEAIIWGTIPIIPDIFRTHYKAIIGYLNVWYTSSETLLFSIMEHFSDNNTEYNIRAH